MERIGKDLLEQSKATSRGAGEKGGSIASRDLLSMLVKANQSENIPSHQKMSDEEVISQVPTFIIAGHETSRYDFLIRDRHG